LHIIKSAYAIIVTTAQKAHQTMFHIAAAAQCNIQQVNWQNERHRKHCRWQSQNNPKIS